jgi:hypothetical protein
MASESKTKICQRLSPRRLLRLSYWCWGAERHPVLKTALHREDRAAQRTENNRARFDPDDVRQLSIATGLHLERVIVTVSTDVSHARRYV